MRRIWRAVMDDIIKDKKRPTLIKSEHAMRDEGFKLIKGKLLVDTKAEDLLDGFRLPFIADISSRNVVEPERLTLEHASIARHWVGY